MASLDSSTRSAARATYSAYKRQPIRWRLAGGSAALTLVILLGFAVIVGTLTTRAIYTDFNRQVASRRRPAASTRLVYPFDEHDRNGKPTVQAPRSTSTRTRPATTRRSASSTLNGALLRRLRRTRRTSARPTRQPRMINGWRVETRELQLHAARRRPDYYTLCVQYGRRVSDVQATANRVKLFLGLGVLGGAALALLAGLATARRAMEPIAELTDAAREIERTRDPSLKMPRPEADDEVAELADDAGVDAARARRGAHGDRGHARAPARVRRRRLARAAHAADLGAGQPRAARGDAARRAARGRRLRPALQRAGCAGWSPTCCCSRAPTPGREPPHRPVDLSSVVADGRLRARAGRRRPRDLDLGARRAWRSRACTTSCTGSCST